MLIVPVSEGEDTQNTVLGAPVGCGVGQNLDNFLTNVQVLSSFCPMFVQVLSMSNMDKYWTNFQENIWNHEHAFILDKSWTKIGHGQNIDKI